MLSLVWKDLLSARWFLVAALPVYAIQLTGLAAVPPVFVLITALFTAVMAYGSLGIEEVQGTEALWRSLPVEWLERWGGILAAGLLAVAVLIFAASAALSARLYASRDC